MRKIKVISMALMLFATVGAFASKGKKTTAKDNLSGQIYEMLKKNQFESATEDLTAKVSFIINKEGELVVLSVDTKNEILENFVKARLNYQKVESDEVVPGRVYEVPVRITD